MTFKGNFLFIRYLKGKIFDIYKMRMYFIHLFFNVNFLYSSMHLVIRITFLTLWIQANEKGDNSVQPISHARITTSCTVLVSCDFSHLRTQLSVGAI